MTPTTRSQAQRQMESDPYQERPPPEDDTDEEEEDEVEDDEDDSSSGDEVSASAPGPLMRGRSTISYDLHALSDASRTQARLGLAGKFVVEECRSTRGGFNFEVADHGRVHIGDGPLACSCDDFKRSGDACRHIFWLVDQLHRWVLGRRPEGQIPLQSNGESPLHDPMIDLIGDNMEEIAKRVKWPYLPGAGSPADSGLDAPAPMSRSDKARDIISAFNGGKIPNEFRPDLLESEGQPRSPEECVVQGDFEATMFRLAVHDDSVYTSLRKVMPAGARAAIFYSKIQRRFKALLNDFDQYCETGNRQPDGSVLEIPTVAMELRKLLHQVRINIQARSPHGDNAAAEALIELLHDIAARNYDAYEDADWGRRPRSGETDEDRNLYHQLICNMDDGQFVLDCLECLSDPILRRYAPKLGSVLEALQRPSTPLPYLRKLQILIAGEKGGPSSGASRQKRPATSESSAESDRKRTK